MNHTEPPYPPLDRKKPPYSPKLAVPSAVLSALILVAQE